MVALAGLKTATEEPLCLSCHTARRPGVSEGPRFTLQEGVGCEACHGAASSWIGPHARGLYHYDEVLAAGLYPTADIGARTQQCLRCHGPNAGVDHRLMAAGHPRPVFDAASYARLQPAHFVVDNDYIQRKRPPSEATVWAIGASGVLGARLRALAASTRAPGLFPEFGVLNCSSCHVAISDSAPAPSGGATWRPPELLNLAELPALAAVAAVIDPALAQALEARAEALRTAQRHRDAIPAAATALAESTDQFAAALARSPITAATAEAALKTLIGIPESPRSDRAALAFATRALARTALAGGGVTDGEARALMTRLQNADGGSGPAGLDADNAALDATLASRAGLENRQ